MENKQEYKMISNLLLCVGAQKAGTTWLYTQLNNHSDIEFSPVKEIHYFNTINNGSILLTLRKVAYLERLIKTNRTALAQYFSDLSQGKEVDPGIYKLLSPVDDNWYIEQFSGSKRYSADFSPEYALIGNVGFTHIKKLSNNPKIIFIMREPISRAKSAIKYYFQMEGIDIKTISNDEILSLIDSDLIINKSQYEITINDLTNNFRDDQVLYLFYENMMNDKQGTLDKVTRFLDIDSVPNHPERLNLKINATSDYTFSKEVDALLLKKLIKTKEFVSNRFNDVPISW